MIIERNRCSQKNPEDALVGIVKSAFVDGCPVTWSMVAKMYGIQTSPTNSSSTGRRALSNDVRAVIRLDALLNAIGYEIVIQEKD